MATTNPYSGYGGVSNIQPYGVGYTQTNPYQMMGNIPVRSGQGSLGQPGAWQAFLQNPGQMIYGNPYQQQGGAAVVNPRLTGGGYGWGGGGGFQSPTGGDPSTWSPGGGIFGGLGLYGGGYGQYTPTGPGGINPAYGGGGAVNPPVSKLWGGQTMGGVDARMAAKQAQLAKYMGSDIDPLTGQVATPQRKIQLAKQYKAREAQLAKQEAARGRQLTKANIKHPKTK